MHFLEQVPFLCAHRFAVQQVSDISSWKTVLTIGLRGFKLPERILRPRQAMSLRSEALALKFRALNS